MSTEQMKIVAVLNPGGPETLRVFNVQVPEIGPNEVLIKVVAVGVNRYDLLVRGGLLPGLQNRGIVVPGVECSGYIINVGRGCTDFSIGDRVCAVLKKGGYAEMVAVSAEHILPVPETFPLVDCAGLPELAFTAWLAVFKYGRVQDGDVLLIHEGCGEIGMLAVILATSKWAEVYLVADTKKKIEMWEILGVRMVFVGKNEEITSQVMKATRGKGVDVILVDQAANLNHNIEMLALRGAAVVVTLRGNRIEEVYLPHLMTKNRKVKAIDRAQVPNDLVSAVEEIKEHVWPTIIKSPVRPVFDFKKYKLSQAADAHRHMEMVQDCWKMILTVSGGDDSETTMEEKTQSRTGSQTLRHRRPASMFKNLLGV